MKPKREAPERRDDDRRRRGREDTRTAGRRRTAAGSAQRTRPRGGRETAPTRDPRPGASGPQTTPRKPAAVRAAKNSSQAKARAKARKAKQPKVVRIPLRERLLTRLASIDLRPRTLAQKVPFVVVIIGALGLGLGLTLWLSTDSAERSYQLGATRKANQLLLQEKEALERDVLQAESAPALAEAAHNLGMIPSKDTAHLIQDPVGNWVVVGTPKPADGVPPPPLNVKLPDEKPAAPPPPADPVEVPVRVAADPGTPAAATGPEVLVRTQDGATTLGEQHLPAVAPGPATPPGPAPGPVAAPGPAPAPVLPPPAATPEAAR